MKASNLMTAMLLGCALVMSACNKKADESTSIGSRAGRGGTTSYTPNGVYYTAQTGQVVANGSTASEYEKIVKGLISASMDANQVGSIGANAVTIKGYVEFDTNGQMIASTSSIQLEIVDSYTNQTDSNGQVVAPIQLHIGGSMSTGTAYSNKTVSLVFQDAYGTVTIQGNYQDNVNFKGVISYQNSTNQTPGDTINHYANNRMSFSIPLCGMFRCH